MECGVGILLDVVSLWSVCGGNRRVGEDECHPLVNDMLR